MAKKNLLLYFKFRITAENKYAMIIHISKTKLVKGSLNYVFEWCKAISQNNINVTTQLFLAIGYISCIGIIVIALIISVITFFWLVWIIIPCIFLAFGILRRVKAI